MTRDQARIIADAMIPGRANRWPAASDAIDVERLLGALTPLFADASGMPDTSDEASGLLARLAAESPAMMRAVTEAVYGAYYASPAVHAVIRDLAESGPREPTATFDESLLNQVRARATQHRTTTDEQR